MNGWTLRVTASKLSVSIFNKKKNRTYSVCIVYSRADYNLIICFIKMLKRSLILKALSFEEVGSGISEQFVGGCEFVGSRLGLVWHSLPEYGNQVARILN